MLGLPGGPQPDGPISLTEWVVGLAGCFILILIFTPLGHMIFGG